MNRADFIPDVIWVHREDGWAVPVNRADDPERWRELVDGDGWVITQVDDGKLEDGKGVVPTSSSSAPAVMAKMLDLLDLHEGMNALEIGAGTGYNAALMAERVAGRAPGPAPGAEPAGHGENGKNGKNGKTRETGEDAPARGSAGPTPGRPATAEPTAAGNTSPGRVTTIEIDSAVAGHARTVLGRTGLPVAVVTGDGALGHPPNAPYDRVMATASALRVPYRWVAQTRPGGRIVLPLVGGFGRGAFLCLAVGGDGSAHGRFHGGASFMRLRNQRDARGLWRVFSPDSAAHYDEDPDGVQIATTRAYHPEPFLAFDAGFAFGARLPGWRAGRRQADGVLLLSHAASGSWATVIPGAADHGAHGEHRVYHQGARRLWEELDAAHRWWSDVGRPDHTRFGLTVTPEHQTFWLDTPDNAVSRS